MDELFRDLVHGKISREYYEGRVVNHDIVGKTIKLRSAIKGYDTGVVMDISVSGNYFVVFPEGFRGHSGSGLIPNKNGWWVNPNRVERIVDDEHQ